MSEIDVIVYMACPGNKSGPAYTAYLVQQVTTGPKERQGPSILPVRFSGATEEEARTRARDQWERDLQIAREREARAAAAIIKRKETINAKT